MDSCSNSANKWNLYNAERSKYDQIDWIEWGHAWNEYLLQGDETKKGKGNHSIRGEGIMDTHLQIVRNAGKEREKFPAICLSTVSFAEQPLQGTGHGSTNYTTVNQKEQTNKHKAI